MRANRRRDTKPERQVRSELHRRGLRFRVDYAIRLEGRRPIRPDIVFTRVRICVELDGCWWHGCDECGQRETRANPAYWRLKIARNKERDLEKTAALETAGWVVLRFWEHEDPRAVADKVAAAVQAAHASGVPRGAAVPRR
jgi:DNA mismatch endonuclease, patch repair protein